MTLKELHNAQLFLPIVFTLEHESFRPVPGHISIFPAFYSVDRCDIIPQALAQSICKDQANHMLGKANDVHELSIYLIDSSDIPSISSLAKDMAVNFPQISCLNFCFERRREIVSFLMTITATWLKGYIYYFSHHMRFKNCSLFSPNCMRYAPMSVPLARHDAGADLNVSEDEKYYGLRERNGCNKVPWTHFNDIRKGDECMYISRKHFRLIESTLWYPSLTLSYSLRPWGLRISSICHWLPVVSESHFTTAAYLLDPRKQAVSSAHHVDIWQVRVLLPNALERYPPSTRMMKQQ